MKYGRLTITQSLAGVRREDKINCICDCGAETKKRYADILKGHTSSCGCLHKETMQKKMTTHGMRSTRIYGIWRTMMARCYLPSQQSYYLYGGRGIEVCEEWVSSFEKFYSDMGDVPFKGAQIDRIDTNGNYTPRNCRWTSAKENSLNKRNTVFLTCQGVTKPLLRWAEELGVSSQMLMSRRWNGWDDEKIVLTPMQPHKPYAPRNQKESNE